MLKDQFGKPAFRRFRVLTGTITIATLRHLRSTELSFVKDHEIIGRVKVLAVGAALEVAHSTKYPVEINASSALSKRGNALSSQLGTSIASSDGNRTRHLSISLW